MSGPGVLAVSPAQIAAYLYSGENMRCNCDLDNWQPTRTTGHSPVCRIHKAASAKPSDMRAELLEDVRAALADVGGAK